MDREHHSLGGISPTADFSWRNRGHFTTSLPTAGPVKVESAPTLAPTGRGGQGQGALDSASITFRTVVTTLAGICILSSVCSCLLPRSRNARSAGSCAPPSYRMRTSARAPHRSSQRRARVDPVNSLMKFGPLRDGNRARGSRPRVCRRVGARRRSRLRLAVRSGFWGSAPSPRLILSVLSGYPLGIVS